MRGSALNREVSQVSPNLHLLITAAVHRFEHVLIPTGWSPRLNDAIFAGCIPVLTAEGTHYPFSTLLDWSKISIHIPPTQLDNLEAILLAIPMAEVERLQANLASVREAFVYASDEDPGEELERRGPMWWSMQEMRGRIQTVYPGDGTGIRGTQLGG
jgi:hypothetical protein